MTSLGPSRDSHMRPGHVRLGSRTRYFVVDVTLLPSMRFIFVPHTGQAPWAALLPFASSTTEPSNSRFSRHLTQ